MCRRVSRFPRRSPTATPASAAEPRRSCRGGPCVGDRAELELRLAGKDPGPGEPPAPQPVLHAGPHYAEAVDHREPEADLARFVEVARRAGDLPDAHSERVRLDEHL